MWFWEKVLWYLYALGIVCIAGILTAIWRNLDLSEFQKQPTEEQPQEQFIEEDEQYIEEEGMNFIDD